MGILNSVGLQNPGVDAFIAQELPELRKHDVKIIANISGNTPEEYGIMCQKLSDAGVDMIEVNVSCPNVKCGGLQYGVVPEMTAEVTEVAKKHSAVPVMVKLSPMLDWHKTVADFAGAVHEVHIVSTGNECKELLLVLGRGRCVSPLVVCANDEQVLSYKAGDNSDNHTTISDSALAARNTCNTEDSLSEESANDFDSSHWKYLYEPNASIMKAGCFDVLEQRFAVHHISPNSHLFVAAEPIADFPGRSFVIESIATMNKKELKQLLAGLTHANIAVRNFPLSVAQLRKKLKLKDGGNTYLFATTDLKGRHLVLRTEKRKSGSL